MIDYQNYINHLILPSSLDKIYRLLLRTNHKLKLKSDRIIVTAGVFRGITIRFYDDKSCTVSCYRSYFSIDLHPDLSPHTLLKLLLKHNMIRLQDAFMNVSQLA